MARTYTVYENPNSRQVQVQTPGVGSSVFSYEFTIRPSGGTEGTTDEEYQAAYSALRTYLGVPIGKLTDISAYSSSPFGSFGSVRSVNMQHEAGADHVYRAVVTWQSEFPEIWNSETTQAMVISGQAAINYSSQPAVRMFDLYKSTALPTSAQQNTAADVAGYYHSDYLIDTASTQYNGVDIESLDVAGRPVKYPSPQIEVVIDEPWTVGVGLSGVGDTTVGAWPKWNANSSLMFRRNESSFMHFPAGTLLYMGTTTSPRQFHTHTLSHRFIYDKFQHFEQQTFQSVVGISNVSGIDDFMSTGLFAATTKAVFWMNYYKVADFTDFTWGNNATYIQVSNGFVDWSGSGNEGPITR